MVTNALSTTPRINVKGYQAFLSAVYAKEYRQLRTQKKAKPTLSPGTLLECSDNIFGMISAWDKLNFPAKDFGQHSRLLAESIYRTSQICQYKLQGFGLKITGTVFMRT